MSKNGINSGFSVYLLVLFFFLLLIVLTLIANMNLDGDACNLDFLSIN